MQTARYVLLFALIQTVSLVLTLIGLPVVGILSLTRSWTVVAGKLQWKGGRLTWIWGNLEDGIVGPGPLNRWRAFYWSGVRNPCNDLRYIRGVSKVGRPLWRKTWGAKPGGFYVAAGWNSSGYPVLSGGRNVNPY